jgi:thiamine-monophosphate kinase
VKSEFEWINRIRAASRRFSPDLVLGIGDDAAILKRPQGKWWLVTTDALFENVHFKVEYTPGKLLGHKSLAVNLSDIAAMGGTPRFFLLAIAVPDGFDEAYLDEFVTGMLETADKHTTVLVGGNVSASQSGLAITITVIGDCSAHMAARRDGAMPGDSVYVTGELGLSAIGLKLLQDGRRLSEELPPELERPILAHLAPQPRVAVGRFLAENRIAGSMIDLSDGLSSDLFHICEESGVGAVITAERLPVFDAGTVAQADLQQEALHGGEDYELLFTVRSEKVAELEAAQAQFPNVTFTCIGRITEETRRLYLEAGGRCELLEPKGYDHFKGR